MIQYILIKIFIKKKKTQKTLTYNQIVKAENKK